MKYTLAFSLVLVLFSVHQTGFEQQYQQSFSFVIQNILVEKEEDPFIKKYSGIYKVPRYITRDTSHIQLSELLYDEVLWRHLEVASYDSLPDTVRYVVLKKQFNSYGYLLDSLFWEKTPLIHWDKAPVPVRSAAYLLMIQRWTRIIGLDSYTETDHVFKWFTAMMMQESFLNHTAVNDGGKFRDIGLPQLSRETRLRLIKSPEFLKIARVQYSISPDDAAAELIFFNPYYSIAAGVMEFRDRLIEADGDLETAIMAYNVGISRAKRKIPRGQKYLDYVRSRYDKYITGDQSASWNYVFDTFKNYNY